MYKYILIITDMAAYIIITIGFKVDFFSITHIFVKHMSGNPDVRETEERDNKIYKKIPPSGK